MIGYYFNMLKNQETRGVVPVCEDTGGETDFRV